MKIGELTQKELHHELSLRGVYLRTGPFVTHVTSSIHSVAEGLHRLYADHPIVNSRDFADFHVTLASPFGLRRWYRSQVHFSFDGMHPFKPLPLAQAFPMFEWTHNWCIANHSNQYLILHAASIEKDGYAAILPGPPGSGKSTLCAALVNRGWRLLSDELALVRTKDNQLVGLARPANLKNDSIDIIQNYAPNVIMGRRSTDTIKGTVAHMRPSTDSVERVDQPAKPAWIIFPRYMKNAEAVLTPRSKACTFIYAAENSFNYSNLGTTGFHVLEKMIDNMGCYDFSYSSLDDAVSVFSKLTPENNTA